MTTANNEDKQQLSKSNRKGKINLRDKLIYKLY